MPGNTGAPTTCLRAAVTWDTSSGSDSTHVPPRQRDSPLPEARVFTAAGKGADGLLACFLPAPTVRALRILRRHLTVATRVPKERALRVRPRIPCMCVEIVFFSLQYLSLQYFSHMVRCTAVRQIHAYRFKICHNGCTLKISVEIASTSCIARFEVYQCWTRAK